MLTTEDITRLKVYVNFHLLWLSSTRVTYFCHECTSYIIIKYYFKSRDRMTAHLYVYNTSKVRKERDG